jgi:hypothetical protein
MPAIPEVPEVEFTRKQQTRVLSVEFLVTMAVQTGVFIVMGTMAFSSVSARVQALESQQVTDARIARLEEKVGTVLTNQQDFSQLLREFQRDARAAKLDADQDRREALKAK